MKLLAAIIFCIVSASARVKIKELKIGGLFSYTEIKEELAFGHAVDVVNRKIAEDGNFQFRLVNLTEKVPEYDGFYVTRIVCKFLSEGVIAIFGPASGDTTSQVQSICDMKGIPHIKASWDSAQRRDDTMVNLYPHPESYSSVIKDIVENWEWENCTVIYEDNESFVRLSKLLRMSSPEGLRINVRHLSTDGNYRKMFREVRDSGERNIVLDCSPGILEEVLIQAQQIGAMTNEYSYIITSLDFHTLDITPFQHAGTNIIGFRMKYNEAASDIASSWPILEGGHGVELSTLKVTEALLYDAVLLFAEGLKILNLETLEVPALTCDTNDAWERGETLVNFLKHADIKYETLTGPIEFDKEGFRSEFELEIFEIMKSGVEVVGTWSLSQGLRIKRRVVTEQYQEDEEDLSKKHFIVLTAITAPYGMVKKSSETLYGNDKYEGFCIDLIDEMAKLLKFNYTFRISEEDSYGEIDNKTGEWKGMLREVNDKKADLAITDLTITSEREKYVDFTTPFMNLGVSILYKKAKKQPPGTFSFMEPFSIGVWICMFSVYIGVSLLLFIMGRICPYEWNNPYPCVEEPEELENQFSLNNSLWFTIGSLMQQGSEIAPIGVSTRMVAGIWWFFTLIMVSSYTANLAAFLTIEKPQPLFANAEGLANHPLMTYGAKQGGATLKVFKKPEQEVYKKMYDFMTAHNELLKKNNEEGVKEVMKQKYYAFLMESSTIKYTIERNCELDMYGEPLDSKGYGIAMRKNQSYLKDMTTAVLKLKENGVIARLENKWWKEKGGGKCADDGGSDGGSTALSLEHVGGVFIVLGVGVFISCIVAFIELLWNTWQIASKEKVPFKSELMHELRFVARMRGSTKPVRKYCEDSIEDEEEEEDKVPNNGIDTFDPSQTYGFKIPLE